MRHAIGLPFGMLLELHGWWHIFTGIGAYVGMATVEYLVTLNDAESQGESGDGFVWPVKRALRDVNAQKKVE